MKGLPRNSEAEGYRGRHALVLLDHRHRNRPGDSGGRSTVVTARHAAVVTRRPGAVVVGVAAALMYPCIEVRTVGSGIQLLLAVDGTPAPAAPGCGKAAVRRRRGRPHSRGRHAHGTRTPQRDRADTSPLHANGKRGDLGRAGTRPSGSATRDPVAVSPVSPAPGVGDHAAAKLATESAGHVGAAGFEPAAARFSAGRAEVFLTGGGRLLSAVFHGILVAGAQFRRQVPTLRRHRRSGAGQGLRSASLRQMRHAVSHHAFSAADWPLHFSLLLPGVPGIPLVSELRPQDATQHDINPKRQRGQPVGIPYRASG